MFKDKKILKHFNNIASSYDSNNEKLYWKLSDDILWEIIKEKIPKYKKINILELGAGTGQWALKILKEYKNVSYTLVDFSKNMLDEARKKLMKYDDRVKFEHINIDDYKSNSKFDIILSIYLLPFYENENKLIKLVSNHLKKNGISISVTENYYNALSLNILKNNIKNVKKMEQYHLGKLSEYVPILKFNTLDDLIIIHKRYNLKPIFICGFPVISLIGVEEVLTKQKNSITSILKNHYDYVLELEKKYIMKENLSDRGKYICIIGEKL